MVYIKLGTNLYSQLKNLVQPDKLVHCEKQFYLPYPQFKKVASKHSMELHKEIGRNDIITYNDMELMIQRARQTPEERRLIEQLKTKSEMRKLKLFSSRTTEDFYFQKKPEQVGIKEMTQSISYSMAFIFSFFMAGLTGYYLGAYFFAWEFINSMILSLVFIFVTIVIETTLFIVRQMAVSSKQKKKTNPQVYQKPEKKTRPEPVSTKDKKQ